MFRRLVTVRSMLCRSSDDSEEDEGNSIIGGVSQSRSPLSRGLRIRQGERLGDSEREGPVRGDWRAVVVVLEVEVLPLRDRRAVCMDEEGEEESAWLLDGGVATYDERISSARLGVDISE